MQDNRQDKAVKRIPANRRAYRMVEAGGELHSVTGARYQRQTDGSLARVNARMTKHARKQLSLARFTNREAAALIRMNQKFAAENAAQEKSA